MANFTMIHKVFRRRQGCRRMKVLKKATRYQNYMPGSLIWQRLCIAQVSLLFPETMSKERGFTVSVVNSKENKYLANKLVYISKEIKWKQSFYVIIRGYLRSGDDAGKLLD